MNLVVYINDGSNYLARGLWTYNGHTATALQVTVQILAILSSCKGKTPEETALNIFKSMGGQPVNSEDPIVSEPIYEGVGDNGAFAEPWATDTMVEVDIADISRPTVKTGWALPTVQVGWAFVPRRLRDITDPESIFAVPPDGPEAVAFDLALGKSPMETWELLDLMDVVTAAETGGKKAIAIMGAEEDDDILLLKEW